MTEETKNETPETIAKDWLYRYERCARDRDYEGASKLLHERCVYFGLESDSFKADWLACWPNQLNLTFDISETKIIPEGNLFLVSTTWLARPVVIGAPERRGRATIGLIRFKEEKIKAVLIHLSRKPE